MAQILLDTDIGNDMDDMQALAYLLSRDDVRLLGITTVTGEAEVRAKLADIMCRLAGKDIPIRVGNDVGLSGNFMQNGVSSVEKRLLDDFPHSDSFPDEPAEEFIRRIIESAPGEVTLCCIGPLTNIAKLFAEHPHIPGMLKTLVIMGGRFGDVDTARWGVQEWNIINDPKAAGIVFDAPVKDVRVFGVELTSKVYRTDTVRVSDEAKLVPCLIPFGRAIRESSEAWYHDVVAVSALFHTDGMKFKRGKISVTDKGDTIFVPDENGCHLLMTELDIGKFFEHYYKTVGISD